MEEKGAGKRILIFEGIASSGKTMLEKLVAGRMPGSFLLGEDETLMPLIDNRNPETALSHLHGLVERLKSNPASVFIVDRFHLTHAFRTGTDLVEFGPIEDELCALGDVTMVFLQIDWAAIKGRICESMHRRQGAWKKGKQGSLEERTDYYTKQQDELLALLRKSELPRLIVDTTDKDWARYADEIVNSLDRISVGRLTKGAA